MSRSDAAAKRQAKKERSRQAKAQRRRQQTRARWQRRLRRGVPAMLVAVVALAIVAGVYVLTSRERRAATSRIGALVEAEPNLGRSHSPSTTSDPAPTSGPHDAGAQCGVVTAPVPAAVQIHTLEHGGVIYQYRKDEVDTDAVGAIEDLARGFGSHVLVAPNPGLDAPVVATAWTRKMRLQEVDLDALRDFATVFRQRAPEDVPCPL